MSKLVMPSAGAVEMQIGEQGVVYKATDGIYSVDDRHHADLMRQAGATPVSNQPKMGRYWLCECGWEALIRHCPKCDRDDLERCER